MDSVLSIQFSGCDWGMMRWKFSVYQQGRFSSIRPFSLESHLQPEGGGGEWSSGWQRRWSTLGSQVHQSSHSHASNTRSPLLKALLRVPSLSLRGSNQPYDSQLPAEYSELNISIDGHLQGRVGVSPAGSPNAWRLECLSENLGSFQTPHVRSPAFPTVGTHSGVKEIRILGENSP